jgi:hypothetical protein
MRIQVRIPPQTWEQVCRLAQAEHRPPKHQIELLLWKAIDRAAQTQGVRPQSDEMLCTTNELAGTVEASHA